MIRLTDIRLAFPDKVLYRGINLHLLPRARCGLVGDNGTGKTTLLRLILDEMSPDTGQVWLRAGLRIGYLPQSWQGDSEGNLLSWTTSRVGDLKRTEKRIAELHQLLAAAPEESLQTAYLKELGLLQEQFERRNGYFLEHNAKVILRGLGFRERDFQRPLQEFSGGWRMRAALGRLLLEDPDLLLLDEPTNHLDLPALEWLERYLRSFDGALLAISHDRFFLDRTVNLILELAHTDLRQWPGNYSNFLRQKEEERQRRLALRAQQEEKITELKRFIERFRYKASKAAQVQSRVKMLEKIELVEVERETAGIHFHFPAAPRTGDWVLRVEQLGMRYGDLEVFRDLSFNLARGEKVALVGANGEGKSTLSRLICGIEQQAGGELVLGHNVLQKWYSQDSEEQMNPDLTVLQEVTQVAGRRTQTEVRTLLGSFLFSGDSVDKKVAVLSGGEKSRLAVCKLLFERSNFLVLDEPTNHLDAKARGVLMEALRAFQGALLIVSHDRWFLDRVVERVLMIEQGMLLDYPGNYTEFLCWREEQLQAEATAAADMVVTSEQSVAALSRKEERKLRTQEKIERRRYLRGFSDAVAAQEQEIERLNLELGRVEEKLLDPQVYEDQELLKKYHLKHNRLRSEKQLAETAWSEAVDRLAAAEREVAAAAEGEQSPPLTGTDVKGGE